MTTEFSNVVLEDAYKQFKTDNNTLFDENEVFVKKILNENLVEKIESYLYQ